jgi:hypothetical protein
VDTAGANCQRRKERHGQGHGTCEVEVVDEQLAAGYNYLVPISSVR